MLDQLKRKQNSQVEEEEEEGKNGNHEADSCFPFRRLLQTSYVGSKTRRVGVDE